MSRQSSGAVGRLGSSSIPVDDIDDSVAVGDDDEEEEGTSQGSSRSLEDSPDEAVQIANPGRIGGGIRVVDGGVRSSRSRNSNCLSRIHRLDFDCY